MSAIQFLVLAALVLSSGANEETLVVKIGWLINKMFKEHFQNIWTGFQNIWTDFNNTCTDFV